MKKLTLIVLATLGLGFTNVQADNIFATGTPYVGAGLGYANVLALSNNNDAFAYNFFGGYLVNATKNLQMGLEVGYTGYSNLTQDTVFDSITIESSTVKTSAVNVLGVAKYNFGLSPIYLIGKVGIGVVNQSVDATILGKSASVSQTKTNAQMSGGVGYKLTSNIATDLTVNYTFGDSASSTSNDTSALIAVMANVTYSF